MSDLPPKTVRLRVLLSAKAGGLWSFISEDELGIEPNEPYSFAKLKKEVGILLEGEQDPSAYVQKGLPGDSIIKTVKGEFFIVRKMDEAELL